MIRHVFLSLLTILFFQNIHAQEEVIPLENPSFEGTPKAGSINERTAVSGWFDCGFPNETPPDLHPEKFGGAFGVTTSPMDGYSYLGMVVRDNETYERIGQKLGSPMKAGVEYVFKIHLARSTTYKSVSRKTMMETNYATPCVLRIWGGNKRCERLQLLGESPAISHEGWKSYPFFFTPEQDLGYFTLEVFYKNPVTFSYNGNLLIDNASAITPFDSTETALSDEELLKSPVYMDSEIHQFERGNSVGNPQVHDFEKEIPAGKFEVRIFTPDDSLAGVLSDLAFARADEIEKTVKGDLKKLYEKAGDGEMIELQEDSWNILFFAKQAYRLTNKNFDVTTGGLREMWKEAAQNQKKPREKDLKTYMDYVRHSDLEVTQSGLARIKEPKLKIDIEDLLTGYILDEMIEVLEEKKAGSFQVKSGDLMGCRNSEANYYNWEYERPLFYQGRFQKEKMAFKNSNIVTVGGSPHFLESGGERYFDFIYPKTGMPATKREVVSIEADSCMKAVAFARALAANYDVDLHLKLKKEGAKIWSSGL